MPPPCPARPELSKWRPAAVLATPASRLLVPPTAAVLTNGSGTPVYVNLVSEQRDDAGVLDMAEGAVTVYIIQEGVEKYAPGFGLTEEVGLTFC